MPSRDRTCDLRLRKPAFCPLNYGHFRTPIYHRSAEFAINESMKILLAFHSRGGSTAKLAERIEENLIARGYKVDVERIRPKKERGFWVWQLLRIFRSDVDIETPNITDATEYDTVILGGPNWTKVSLPMRRYISGMKGLRGKSVGLFSTTALWPSFEWYFFSAYILFTTFSKAVVERGGRVVDSILLSSLIKSQGVDSERGKVAVDDFCRKIASREGRFKKDIIRRKETEDIRFLTVFFSSLALLSIILQASSIFFGFGPLAWDRFWAIFLILVVSTGLMARTIEKKRDPFFVKFMASISLVLIWTIMLASMSGDIHGITQAGYIAIFVFMGLFKNISAVLTAGLTSILGYSYIFIFYPETHTFHPTIDIASLSLVLTVVAFVTHNIEKYFINLTEAQEEAETARMILEVKVRARTRELEEFSKDLEKSVQERTKDLENKVEELEKFSKLTVGREMRMIELKEKLKELEEKTKRD